MKYSEKIIEAIFGFFLAGIVVILICLYLGLVLSISGFCLYMICYPVYLVSHYIYSLFDNFYWHAALITSLAIIIGLLLYHLIVIIKEGGVSGGDKPYDPINDLMEWSTWR